MAEQEDHTRERRMLAEARELLVDAQATRLRQVAGTGQTEQVYGGKLDYESPGQSVADLAARSAVETIAELLLTVERRVVLGQKVDDGLSVMICTAVSTADRTAARTALHADLTRLVSAEIEAVRGAPGLN